MSVFIMMAIHLLVLYASYEILRRHPWLVWGVFIVAPVLSIPLWLGGVSDWFLIAKTYTMAVAMLWFQATRSFQKLRTSKIMFGGLYLLLIINIIEAVFKDIQTGSYLNAFAGALLCITLPTIKDIIIDKDGKYNDVLWSMSKLWIVAYTIWNITFVLGNFPHGVGASSVLLAVPLIIGLFKPKIWAQVRAITLATHLMMRIYFANYFERLSLPWMSEVVFFLPLLNGLQVVSLLLSIVCIGIVIFNKRKAVAF
ncbi:MAG: hypothetical protein COA82_07455 [Alkaliphilus sp.]|nr:hypothetical protein [Alkaliphilus sp. AH-315-G20]MBN4067697.1 hypothetical protein [Alkaliphilus transvaalensis]MBN4069656.1 hypothetical protein [bacterium AH-315-G05]PHS34204.1 MAG: hypothetical protein COA82_07455 [Alkaliphilus sp.]